MEQSGGALGTAEPWVNVAVLLAFGAALSWASCGFCVAASSSQGRWQLGTTAVTLIWAVLDAVLVAILVWRLPSARFRRLARPLALTAGAAWASFGSILIWITWDTYYANFLPSWAPYAGPIIAVEYGLAALGMWWLACRLPLSPVLGFCLLGGLESIPEHLLGIYVFKILELPILSHQTAGSILLFAFFEYILYWGAVLALAALLAAAWRRRTPTMKAQG